MNIKIHHIDNKAIAEVISERVILNNVQDVLDLISESFSQGSRVIILQEKNILTDFFDLKTRIAGEILQKFTTYNIHLAIVGDFSKYTSTSLQDFIFESNKHGRIIFVSSVGPALERFGNLNLD